MRFLDALQSGRTLIADGASGTLLQAAGLPNGMIPEEWNLLEPDKIAALHQAYHAACANILLTNTFGANRLKLLRSGHAAELERFNRAGVEIARPFAGPTTFIAGDLGPTGELMQPLGSLTMEEARRAYAEQAAILADAGVDLLVIETMSALDEAMAAVEGAHAGCDLPVVCTMSFDTRQHTMMGVTPEKMIQTLWPLGLAAIGGNCGKALEDNLLVVRRLRAAHPEATLWMKANAGLPNMVNDQAVYNVSPAEFATYGRLFVEAGARVVGGCCGTTPAHIAAAAQALAGEERRQ